MWRSARRLKNDINNQKSLWLPGGARFCSLWNARTLLHDAATLGGVGALLARFGTQKDSCLLSPARLRRAGAVSGPDYWPAPARCGSGAASHDAVTPGSPLSVGFHLIAPSNNFDRIENKESW